MISLSSVLLTLYPYYIRFSGDGFVSSLSDRVGVEFFKGVVILVKPFYMWAGGKSKLVKHYADVWGSGEFSSYVEPFFGGGAVFGWRRSMGDSFPAVLGDVNSELVGVLKAVRDDVEGFIVQVDPYVNEYLSLPVSKEARKGFYYMLRREYWVSGGENTALLYVLMKLGFNGIWQTCKESGGLFGTPAGLLQHKVSSQVYSPELLREWSKHLQGVSLQAVGYDGLKFDPADALIYLDPPYRDSFTTYGTVFGDVEQRELVEWCLEQVRAGATVLLANRCVEGDSFFEDLLPDAKFHYFDVVYTAGRRKRVDNKFLAKTAREFLAVMEP